MGPQEVGGGPALGLYGGAESFSLPICRRYVRNLIGYVVIYW
jgi:hypothetical protein